MYTFQYISVPRFNKFCAMEFRVFLFAVFVMTSTMAVTSAFGFGSFGGAPGAAPPAGGAGPGAFGSFGPAPPGGADAPAPGPPSEPTCPPTDGMVPLYVPDPDDCTKYTVCSGGFGMKLDCPVGLHFDKLTNHCDFPPIANCEVAA